MSIVGVSPGVLVVVAAVVLGLFRTPLTPRFTVCLLTTAAVLAATTTFVIASATAAGFLAGPARTTALLNWCQAIPGHHRVGTVAGIISLLALVSMATRTRAVIRLNRAALADAPDQRINIVDTPEPLAYAVPRGEGCVVVSTGLLAALDPRERQVVFAHERAHLSQHHHRYLLAGAVAQAILPPLKPLLSQLRHATERCADEEAVSAMSGDRSIVATAIARAALHTTAFRTPLPSFGGGTVPARVQALIGERPEAAIVGAAAGFTLIAAIALAGGASLQMHHLYALYDHVCHT